MYTAADQAEPSTERRRSRHSGDGGSTGRSDQKISLKKNASRVDALNTIFGYALPENEPHFVGLGSFSPLGVCWVIWGLIQDGARLLSSGLKPNNSLPENLRLVWDYGEILGSPWLL